MQRLLALWIFLVPPVMTFSQQAGTTALSYAAGRNSFDNGWKFIKADISNGQDPTLSDENWRLLNLPHDWSIEDLDPNGPDSSGGPFSKTSIGGQFTGNTVGGIAWYRKHFSVAGQPKNRVYILFDGVYLYADIWINGHYLGYHPNGYTPFYFDITGYLLAGHDNLLAVKVSNLGRNSRWYAGSGIYRHVWLNIVPETHILPMGIHVTTPEVSAGHARVQFDLDIANVRADGHTILMTKLIDPAGNVVSVSNKEIKPAEEAGNPFTSISEMKDPVFWSPDHPRLYKAVMILKTGNKTVDSQSVSFGIRSISISAEKGLLVNGERVILRGGCLHQDYGPLGTATIDRAEERRLQILKANGFNAIRTSHNPPSPYFLDLCDRLGFFVIDEAFDEWEQKKLFDDSSAYHHFFKDWWKKDIDGMVRRDRNHPSVLLWSIGNEIHERGDPDGLRIARDLIAAIRTLDSTRMITEGVCWFWDHPGRPWDDLEATFALLDVAGYNYEWQRCEEDHKKFPFRIIAGTETYPMESFDNYEMALKHPYVLGDFVWTAWDYIGEAGIGHALWQPDSLKQDKTMLQPWPWFNANCGDFDFTGNKKPQSYYRDVVWGRSKLEFFVRPPAPPGMKNIPNGWGWPDEIKSWTWPGQENKKLTIAVYSRCDMLRLELNGRRIEERTVAPGSKWQSIFECPYEPGTLRVTGYIRGKKVAEDSLVTVGKPYSIRLTADRRVIHADGKDLSFVQAEITDEHGRWIPEAGQVLEFSVAGSGVLLAVANANPAGLQSFRKPRCLTFKGKCLLIVQSGRKPGAITVVARSAGLNAGKILLAAK